MSSLAEDVATALARAAAFGTGAARGCTVADAAAALDFVAMRIEGTILPRTLQVAVNDRPVLHCVVAGGRVLRWRGAGQEAGWDTPDAARLRAAIVTVAPPGARIAVTSGPPDGEGGGAGSGLSASALRAAQAADDAAPPGEATLLDRFLDDAGPQVLAAARLDDDLLYPVRGDDAALDRLTEAVEPLLATLEACRGDTAWPGTALVLRVAGQELLALSQAEGPVVMLVAAERGPALIGQWQALLAAPRAAPKAPDSAVG